jgi:hypothetical protein
MDRNGVLLFALKMRGNGPMWLLLLFQGAFITHCAACVSAMSPLTYVSQHKKKTLFAVLL